jgi:hypothetical protein
LTAFRVYDPEADIASRPHLPLATEYADRDALKDVRDNALAAMRTECAVWTDHMDRFRASLVTPAAMVLWRVLIAEERTLVADALERVLAEIGDRRLGEAADAVPAQGEDGRRLDGDGTRFAEDDHASDE